jgi:hypothetical protein
MINKVDSTFTSRRVTSSCPPTEVTASVSPYGCTRSRLNLNQCATRSASDDDRTRQVYLGSLSSPESEGGVRVGWLGQDRSDVTLRACCPDGPLVGVTTLILPFPPRSRQVSASKDTHCRSRAGLRRSLFRFSDSAKHQDRRKCFWPCVKGGGTQLVVRCLSDRAIPGDRCPGGGIRGRGR